MLRGVLLAGVVALAFSGCKRKPCEDEEAEGPRVRLDVALGTCNARPIAAIDILTSPVRKNQPIVLDASASVDLNGDPLTFEWTLTPAPGSTAQISENATLREASFVPDRTGSYLVSLTVSDGELSGTGEATIGVKNELPIANAGLDLRTDIGAAVMLDGSASADPDGDAITYSWAIDERPGGAAGLENGMTARATIIPDVRGPYVVSLVVSDGDGQSEKDTMRVLAGVSSSEPVADAGADRTGVTLGVPLTLDGTGSFDDDGDTLTYLWEIMQRPSFSNAELADATSAQPSFTPDRFGRYVVQLTVSDGYYSSADTVTFDASELSSSASVDPGHIYMLGTLVEGREGWDVICDIFQPDAPLAGFPQVTVGEPLGISPDGRLFYTNINTFEVYQFVPDPLRFTKNAWIYPTDPQANDPLEPVSPCGNELLVDDVVALMGHPRTGEIIHTCRDSTGWFDRSGAPVPTCGPGAFGIDENGATICSHYDASGSLDGVIVATSTGGQYFNSDVTDPGVLTARARPGGGFLVAIENAVAGDSPTRWTIGSDGSATFEGTYAAYPEDFVGRNSYGVLDPQGNFYRSGFFNVAGIDVIIRLNADLRTFDVVYDEGTLPGCKWHGSVLVTGP